MLIDGRDIMLFISSYEVTNGALELGFKATCPEGGVRIFTHTFTAGTFEALSPIEVLEELWVLKKDEIYKWQDDLTSRNIVGREFQPGVGIFGATISADVKGGK